MKQEPVQGGQWGEPGPRHCTQTLLTSSTCNPMQVSIFPFENRGPQQFLPNSMCSRSSSWIKIRRAGDACQLWGAP